MNLEVSDEKRVQLLTLSLSAERIGESQMDVALRMVIEAAMMCYVDGQFEMLQVMAKAPTSMNPRGGNA